jgi:zona occludens toxin
MAINVYCGLQGSGKSYEVVSMPVLDAIAAGRRVVTNVDGIDEEAIHAHLVKSRKVPSDQLGQVVHVSNERVTEAAFFPDGDHPETVTLVQPGDLIAIDEAWRFWPEGAKLSAEHMQFFRMHRHYVHPVTGVACDIVLMTQDVSGLCRALKNVVELSFRMHKLKALGMARSYRVELYEGWRQNRKTRVDVFTRRYRPEIFPLYKSYAGEAGIEKTIDRRQNILLNPKLWAVSLCTVAAGATGAWQFWAFFHPKDQKPVATADARKASPHAVSTDAVHEALPRTPSSSLDSNTWRVAGRYKADGLTWIVLVNPAGRLRVESPSLFANDGMAVIGSIEGERVSTWSGGFQPGAGYSEPR